MTGPSIIPFGGVTPDIARAAFIAPGSRLIGDVTIGEDASIWYNCVLRGDVGKIVVGARTNIQDGTVVHVNSGSWGTDIGADCLIGHLAMVHGCKLHAGSFVGLGAIVMDDCEIEAEGMLAAGAMLTPGKRIGAGEMWGGRPAKLMRALSEDEKRRNRWGIGAYVENARAHAVAIIAAAGGKP